MLVNVHELPRLFFCYKVKVFKSSHDVCLISTLLEHTFNDWTGLSSCVMVQLYVAIWVVLHFILNFVII